MEAVDRNDEPFGLARFAEAQAGDWERVCAELKAGAKRSHWIWYVFPQLKGLGSSPMAQHYGIGSIGEAQAYLAHRILGARLEEATRLVLAHAGRRNLREIFGSPDDLKFRSSMTLFARAAGPGSVYGEALEAFCGGAQDERTLSLLRE